MSRIVSDAPEVHLAQAEVERGPAEVAHAGLERDTRPGRGLVEDHPERAAREETVLARARRALELVGQVEQRAQLARRPVRDAKEVATPEVHRHVEHAGIVPGTCR